MSNLPAGSGSDDNPITVKSVVDSTISGGQAVLDEASSALDLQFGGGAKKVDKYVRLQYPLNVEGPGERHFMRFEPLTIRGATLQTEKVARTVSEARANKQESKSNFFKNIVSGVATKAGEAAGELAKLSAKAGIANVAGKKLPGEAIDAIGFISGLIISATNSSKSTSRGSITLYTPPNLQESYAPEWNTTAQLGALGGLGMRTLSAAQSGGAGAAFAELINDATNTGQGMNLAAKLLADEVGSRINSQGLGDTILKRTSGQALNPHLEALFQNVNFRNFTFDFTMAPRNRREAQEIHKIVQSFKYFAAPRYDRSDSGVFFKYPDVFNISYFNEDQTHKFQPCALTSINVTRNPFETNATFYDGHPVQTQMTLNFTEVALVTKDHIDQGF